VNNKSGVKKKDVIDEDMGIAANQLGKLNGFFHASPQALANASPNSAPGAISQGFRDVLREYASQLNDTETTGVESPTLDEVAHALATAVNKEVSPEIVGGILDKLSQTYGDDYSGLTDPDESSTEGQVDAPQKSFAEALSDRVNEINGYSSDDESGPADHS
jgi:hypothetical protein